MTNIEHLTHRLLPPDLNTPDNRAKLEQAASKLANLSEDEIFERRNKISQKGEDYAYRPVLLALIEEELDRRRCEALRAIDFPDLDGLDGDDLDPAYDNSLLSAFNSYGDVEEILLENAAKSLDGLKWRLQHAFDSGDRVGAFLASWEFTRRGVAPVFRGLKFQWNKKGSTQMRDLMTFDLEWLRRRHPELAQTVSAARSRSALRRLADVFSSSERLRVFLRGVAVSLTGNYAMPWKLCSDLKLTEIQQTECRTIRSSEVSKRIKAVRERLQAMRDTIEAMENGGRCGRSEEERRQTVQRRVDLWFCSELAGRDRPTAIAKLYTSMTGDPITKEVVSNQLSRVPTKARRTTGPGTADASPSLPVEKRTGRAEPHTL